MKDNEKVISSFKSAWEILHPSENVDQKLLGLRVETRKSHVESRILNRRENMPVITDLDGNPFPLNSIENKTVIMEFWNPECSSCAISFPVIENAAKQYGDDKNLVFLICAARTKGDQGDLIESVKQFISQNPTDIPIWIVASDPSGLVDGVPTRLIFDPEGKLRYKDVGVHMAEYLEWDFIALQELLLNSLHPIH